MPRPGTLDALIAALDTRQYLNIFGVNAGANTATAGVPVSSWMWGPASQPRGNVPPAGAGEACSGATLGALPFTPAGVGLDLYILSAAFWCTLATGGFLADRLVHTSGLSGTDVTAQAVNSVALPARATGGEDVQLWLECYTLLGATARQATISYTNQAGVAGRTAITHPTAIPANMRAGSMVRAVLQQGDTGVRSVETVTLSGSTGAVGNFGVTLLRPVMPIPGVAANSVTPFGPTETGLVVVDDDACLFAGIIGVGTGAGQFELNLALVSA